MTDRIWGAVAKPLNSRVATMGLPALPTPTHKRRAI